MLFWHLSSSSLAYALVPLLFRHHCHALGIILPGGEAEDQWVKEVMLVYAVLYMLGSERRIIINIINQEDIS